MGVPSGRWSVHTRPPTRSRASSTTTERPACARRHAAVRPAKPAPTTQTSARVVSISLLGAGAEPRVVSLGARRGVVRVGQHRDAGRLGDVLLLEIREVVVAHVDALVDPLALLSGP